MVSRTEMEIERLIGRCLDGEASEQEQLELQREMLRNPEVHRLFDESQRIDEVAGSALREILRSSGDAAPLKTSAEPPVPFGAAASGRRSGWRIPPRWLFVPGAIAAAILALIIPSPVGRVIEQQTAQQTHAQRPTYPDGLATSAVPSMPGTLQAGDGLMRNVGMGAPQIQRKSGREVLGIVGDDGSIYWIEIDRTRTIRGRFPSWGSSNLSETF